MKIDLVTQTPAGDFALIIVEQGPWPVGTEADQLLRVQDRLNDYLNALLGGHLARQYPVSAGRAVRIQVDGYDVPNHLVKPLVERFSEAALAAPEVAEMVGPGKLIKEITFVYEGQAIEAPEGHVGKWRELWRRLTSG